MVGAQRSFRYAAHARKKLLSSSGRVTPAARLRISLARMLAMDMRACLASSAF
jgi:hypothetical protein